MPEPRTTSGRIVPMKVIVCGVQRTGTMSMRDALTKLGFYDCYHMRNVSENVDTEPQKWISLMEAKYGGKGQLTKQAFDQVLGRSQACVDMPSALFGVELAEMYPDAKVIILNRDPARWYRSVMNTIHRSVFAPSLAHRLSFLYVHLLDPLTREYFRFFKVLHEKAFQFEYSEEKNALAWYERQYREYRERIPAHRRMEFEVGQGWGPLCEFLGAPVPMVEDEKTGALVEAPFPWVNDTQNFIKMHSEDHMEAVRRATNNLFYGLGRFSITCLLVYSMFVLWQMFISSHVDH